ncbi:DUF1648 domain-containing protein [Lacticaseibacillus jixiensis]|uniref:DUF1648 domain-containing protein n=1 Tax=Lacticaseibacillus jixiensis TaxID=3231926 RepID=UPI0036F1D34C
MTKDKWRTLLITSAVIVAVIFYGVSQYETLPQMMVTHWGIDDQPNGWMPKAMVVYGVPVMMLLIHWFCMGVTYYAAAHGQGAPRMERVLAWFFPVSTIVVYVIMIRYAQGHAVNVRLWAIALVGAMFIFLGNYLPTVPATSPRKGWIGFGFHVPWQVTNPAGALKTLRVLGYVMVAGGVLLLGSLFFAPAASVVALVIVIAAIVVMMPLSYVWTTRPDQ